MGRTGADVGSSEVGEEVGILFPFFPPSVLAVPPEEEEEEALGLAVRLSLPLLPLLPMLLREEPSVSTTARTTVVGLCDFRRLFPSVVGEAVGEAVALPFALPLPFACED